MITYQLKIEVTGSQPPIWRRITLSPNTSFDNFHDIIQIVMDWQNSFPYRFRIDDTTVRDFDAEVDLGDNPNDQDAIGVMLDDLVTVINTSFIYTYGSNDPWEHKITLEKVLQDDEEESEVAVCIEGKGDRPPEDCGGILSYQQLLLILADKKHPEHDNIKSYLDGPEGVSHFDVDEINARLRRYAEEWEEIYNETQATLDQLEGRDSDNVSVEDEYNQYQILKYFKAPEDLLTDEFEREEMEIWLDEAIAERGSAEYKTLHRLLTQGYDEEKSRIMIREALSIEWFYDLKYGTGHLDDRYRQNLQQLPETPLEIPSLDCAIQILNECTKGIPFSAIEYLHNDKTPESTSAIVQALEEFSQHKKRWKDWASTTLWYSLAAEGHLCEALIDPIISLYNKDNKHATDWMYEQGQYLIGKLAQTYPDLTSQKVLAAMEKDAEHNGKGNVYYLFDVFDFCNIEKYKGRLISLLKRDDLYWHDILATTIAHLQIKEGLPVLKEQLSLLEANKAEHQPKGIWNTIEIREAIEQLETGVDLYPDVDMPLCLKRTTTWREEFIDAEEHFYDDGSLEEDIFDLGPFDADQELPWGIDYQQPIIKENKTGRNDPCPCGSGKKYKKCCLDKDIRENKY